ncbi:MAG: transketolase C-terminal domain-containing protein [Solirubrobacteraceae bacterium]
MPSATEAAQVRLDRVTPSRCRVVLDNPLDYDTLAAAAVATGGRLVVAEDHWVEGGIGEAVCSAFADKDDRPH